MSRNTALPDDIEALKSLIIAQRAVILERDLLIAAAIGGDLAYRYNRFGTLSDISFNPALSILGNAGFVTSAQTLQGTGSLQDTTPRLS